MLLFKNSISGQSWRSTKNRVNAVNIFLSYDNTFDIKRQLFILGTNENSYMFRSLKERKLRVQLHIEITPRDTILFSIIWRFFVYVAEETYRKLVSLAIKYGHKSFCLPSHFSNDSNNDINHILSDALTIFWPDGMLFTSINGQKTSTDGLINRLYRTEQFLDLLM